jgi:hypothetical protein
MTMIRRLLGGYDFNLPLHDALADPTLSPDRRALAAVSMRQGLDDALFSAHELLEAFRTIETDHRLGVAPDASEGAAAINAILVADGDDYQRRLHWMLSEVAVADAISDLVWLTELLRGRAVMHRTVQEIGARTGQVPGDRR